MWAPAETPEGAPKVVRRRSIEEDWDEIPDGTILKFMLDGKEIGRSVLVKKR